MPEITDDAGLREVVAEPPRAVAAKATDRVDDESRRLLEASPLFLLATTGADGSVDVSPRGDPAGGVLVLDDGRAVAFGDRKGNRHLDSLRNILARPQVGMLFLVPGSNDTLRINGRARILREPPLADRLAVRGQTPDLVIVVEIDELFLHCAKAFLRAALWDPATWPNRGDLPTAGQMYKAQSGTRVPARLLDAAMRAETRTRQY